MITQNYVSADQHDEFITSIEQVMQKDPRLSLGKLSTYIGHSKNYLSGIRRGKLKLSQETYDKWFNDVLPRIEKRLQLYTNYSDIQQRCLQRLDDDPKPIAKALNLSSSQLKLNVRKGKAWSTYQVYDVILGLPSYEEMFTNDSNNDNNAEVAERPLVTEIRQLLTPLRQNKVAFQGISYMLTSRKDLYTRIFSTKGINLNQPSYKLAERSVDELRKLSTYVQKRASRYPAKVRVSVIEQETGKGAEMLRADSQKYLDNDKLLHRPGTEVPKAITRGRALTILGMEYLLNER